MPSDQRRRRCGRRGRPPRGSLSTAAGDRSSGCAPSDQRHGRRGRAFLEAPPGERGPARGFKRPEAKAEGGGGGGRGPATCRNLFRVTRSSSSSWSAAPTPFPSSRAISRRGVSSCSSSSQPLRWADAPGRSRDHHFSLQQLKGGCAAAAPPRPASTRGCINEGRGAPGARPKTWAQGTGQEATVGTAGMWLNICTK